MAWARRGLAGLVALAGIGVAGAPAAQARQVSLELLLAVDTSSSVNFDEFNLQMQGYAAAFSDPLLMKAIRASGTSGVAVALVQWAGVNQADLAIGWTHITDQASANTFAAGIANSPRYFNFGATAIGDMIRRAVSLFQNNGYEGLRQVIDVSGDGRSNEGLPPQIVRQAAILAGISINGLAILNEEPGLERYYRRDVVGGESSFLITAESFADFRKAILAKLLQEVQGAPVAAAPGAPQLAGRATELP